jgi:hypothetical protein
LTSSSLLATKALYGKPNKKLKKTQKYKQEETKAISTNIWDFFSRLRSIKKLKLKIAKQMMLGILEA